MHQTIICVPTPREIRDCPLDPKVERIVQEEIGEDRADYAPLRGSTQPLNELAVFFHRRHSPSFDVEQRPFALYVLPDRLQQKIMRKIVKQPFDVELEHPVVLPAPLTRDPYSIQGRLSRPVPV